MTDNITDQMIVKNKVAITADRAGVVLNLAITPQTVEILWNIQIGL